MHTQAVAPGDGGVMKLYGTVREGLGETPYAYVARTPAAVSRFAFHFCSARPRLAAERAQFTRAHLTRPENEMPGQQDTEQCSDDVHEPVHAISMRFLRSAVGYTWPGGVHELHGASARAGVATWHCCAGRIVSGRFVERSAPRHPADLENRDAGQKSASPASSDCPSSTSYLAAIFASDQQEARSRHCTASGCVGPLWQASSLARAVPFAPTAFGR